MRFVFRCIRLGALLVLLFFFDAWSLTARSSASRNQETPLAAVLRRGVLCVALDDDTHAYFIHKGRPVGYQFELLSHFATSLGVELHVLPVQSPQQGLEALAAGRVSIYAPTATDLRDTAWLYATAPYDTVGEGDSLENPQSIALYLLAEYPDLALRANQWLVSYVQQRSGRRLRRKYSETGTFRKVYARRSSNRISPYDRLIRKATKQSQLDWRLVASLIYQESRFIPTVESPMGAYGLMQFTPSAASYFGIPHHAKPRVQVEAGVRYLEWLDEQFAKRGVPAPNRVEFILAAYNAGLGSVDKARRKAEKAGKSPDVWAGNVALYCSKRRGKMPNFKRYSQYGMGETCNYVYEILNRYEHYKNILDA